MLQSITTALSVYYLSCSLQLWVSVEAYTCMMSQIDWPFQMCTAHGKPLNKLMMLCDRSGFTTVINCHPTEPCLWKLKFSHSAICSIHPFHQSAEGTDEFTVILKLFTDACLAFTMVPSLERLKHLHLTWQPGGPQLRGVLGTIANPNIWSSYFACIHMVLGIDWSIGLHQISLFHNSRQVRYPFQNNSFWRMPWLQLHR